MRRPFIQMVVVTLALLLPACAFPQGSQPAPQPVALKVVVLPFVGLGPIFIAQGEGYFAEQRLQVEFVKLERPADAITALASGELDVTTRGAAVDLLNAMQREGSMKYVAEYSVLDPGACAPAALVARLALVESGQLDSAAQLRGKRIAMGRANFEEYYIEKLLASAGLTLQDIEVVSIPDPAKVQAIQDGSVDLASAGEPTVTRMLATGQALVWKTAPKVIPNFPFGFVVYGPNLLEKNPEAGKRFMTAFLKAARQFQQGKTERNLEILAKYTELDRSTLMQTCWQTTSEDGRIMPQGLLDYQAWAVAKGLLDTPLAENQFWDPRFVEHANQALGAPSQ